MNSKELELRNQEITDEVKQLHNEIKELENEELRNEELRGEKLKKELLERYSKDELRMANRILAHHATITSDYPFRIRVKDLTFSEKSLSSLDRELKQVLDLDLLA